MYAERNVKHSNSVRLSQSSNVPAQTAKQIAKILTTDAAKSSQNRLHMNYMFARHL